MENPLDMVKYAKECVVGVTNAEHQALRDITKPCVRENLNEACNRRAQLALTTFEAAMKARLYAAQEAQKGMSDPFSAEYLLKSGRIAMILDLFDDMIITKKEFTP